MYRGRYQLGREIPIGVQCRTGAKVPGAPTAAPQYRIYSEAGGAAVATGSLPPTERYITTGLHEYSKLLGTGFAAGRYYIRYTYTVSGTPVVDIDAFEVLAGGVINGTTVSMYFLDRPDGDWIVTQSSAGGTNSNRGPHV